jgi:sulfite exporter TauE/SafE
VENTIDYFSMFLLGFFGSGHCLGMCGPIVVALPGRYERWQAHLIYHLGRVATYVLVGALLGGVGHGVIRFFGPAPSQALLWTSRLQLLLSLPVALFLLLMGLTRMGLLSEPLWLARAMPTRLPGYEPVMAHVLDRRNLLWLLAMGLLLGLLPCGLSYGAFARALAAGGMAQGAFLTALFGMGTLPVLLLLGTGAARLFQRFRLQMEMISGLIMIGMAVSLLAKAGSVLFSR